MKENDKGKTRKFNFIDALMILLVIAVIGVVAYLFLNNKIFSTDEKTEILYTIRIDRVKNELIDDIKKLEKGQTITDSVRGYDLGKIEKIEITQATANLTNRSKGYIFKDNYPDYSQIVITVRADSVEEPYGYDLNGYKIMVGAKVDFRTPYLISYGYCRSVTHADGSKSSVIETNQSDTDDSDVSEPTE